MRRIEAAACRFLPIMLKDSGHNQRAPQETEGITRALASHMVSGIYWLLLFQVI